MTGLLWAALGVIGGFGLAAVGDMVSEEVRDRLDHLPHAILGLAALRLDPTQRITVYEDEWLPELAYILQGDEARPVTRLYHGTRFAIGVLVTAQLIARRLKRPVPALPQQPGVEESALSRWMGIEGRERYVALVAERQDLNWRAVEISEQLKVLRYELSAPRSRGSARAPRRPYRKLADELESYLLALDQRRGMLDHLIGDVQEGAKTGASGFTSYRRT